MAEKSVLFVGLVESQREQIELPDGTSLSTVDSIDEALDHLSLSPAALIVANDRIGSHDSLDLYDRILKGNLDESTPVLFLVPEGSGMQPFVYLRQRHGFEVCYLDAQGAPHSHFIKEAPNERGHSVRTLHADRLNDDIALLLSDDDFMPPEESADMEQRLWELGFNRDLAVEGQSYHIQTEITEVRPLTISTTVFSDGRALHAQQDRLKTKDLDLDAVRHELEIIHAKVVGRISRGELG